MRTQKRNDAYHEFESYQNIATDGYQPEIIIRNDLKYGKKNDLIAPEKNAISDEFSGIIFAILPTDDRCLPTVVEFVVDAFATRKQP